VRYLSCNLVKLLTDVLLNYYRTLTSPVSLLQCLKSIKEYAFVKSEYPLVITLEDHLTPDLQAKVAKVGLLYIPPPPKHLLHIPILLGVECNVSFHLLIRRWPHKYLENCFIILRQIL